MKFVLWISGLFALAVLAGLLLTMNTGYAILFLPPYRIDISFNSLIIVIVVLIIAVHFLLELISMVAQLPKNVRQFQRQRQLKAARHALCKAGIAYFEGRFQRAEREAQKAIKGEHELENRALAMLIAARSAGAMQDFRKRDGYLIKFDALPESLQLARHMLDAEVRLEARDLLGALAAIQCARTLSPNLTSALRLELKVRLIQKQPEAVLTLTQKLLKAEAISPEQGRRYRLAAYIQQLMAMVDSQEIRYWIRRIPDAERCNPRLVSIIVKQLIAVKDYDYAASLLANALANDDQTTLELSCDLSLLAEHVSDKKRFELLTYAESWLKRRPRDYQLLLALGRLAYAQQLWGKAQSYLEASLSIQSTLGAHAQLVRLFEATGQEEQAAHHYRQSLAIALKQGL